jgi:hypothetical protein
LARAKDICHVSDRVSPLSLTLSGAVATFTGSVPISVYQTNGTTVSSGILGLRVSDIGGCFVRYRINRLLACWRPICGTNTSGRIGIGFADDAFPYAGQTPGNDVAITDFRCSHSDSVYRDIEVEWTPIDKNKWYYVDINVTGSSADQRLAVPALLVYAGDGLPTTTTTYGGVTLYYDLTFEGASSASSVTP